METGEWLAGDEKDFLVSDRRILEIDGREVVVLQVGGAYHAFVNRCIHMGGPVGEGAIIGRVEAVLDDEQRQVGERFSDTERQLVCPWHGWAFDVETGACAGDPRRRLTKLTTSIREGRVYVHA